MPALKSRLPLGSSLVSLASRAHANAPNPLALLRARRERPRDGRAAKERDELAPHQLEFQWRPVRTQSPLAAGGYCCPLDTLLVV